MDVQAALNAFTASYQQWCDDTTAPRRSVLVFGDGDAPDLHDHVEEYFHTATPPRPVLPVRGAVLRDPLRYLLRLRVALGAAPRSARLPSTDAGLLAYWALRIRDDPPGRSPSRLLDIILRETDLGRTVDRLRAMNQLDDLARQLTGTQDHGDTWTLLTPPLAMEPLALNPPPVTPEQMLLLLPQLIANDFAQQDRRVRPVLFVDGLPRQQWPRQGDLEDLVADSIRRLDILAVIRTSSPRD